MRFRNLLLALITICVALTTSACGDITAPEEPWTKVHFAPFLRTHMEIPVSEGYFSNQMTFWAPPGVNPLVEIVYKAVGEDPKLEFLDTEPQSQNLCNQDCTREAWTLPIYFRARAPGHAEIRVIYKFNRAEQSSFTIIAKNFGKG